jgi:single-stranded-DNA-specific exonuclease
MFLSQPLMELLIERGIRDVDEFLRQPLCSDFANPFFLPNLAEATSRVVKAIREGARIIIFGDYDCDGVMASHVLESVLRRLGARVRVYLPHRDEGYGLSTQAVHKFSLAGTDLLITVDNGINARAAVSLARRLGIDVIVIDHHRVQEKAETLAVWSDDFCGTGLAVMVAIGLAQKSGWNECAIEKLIAGTSIYGSIASIADCVPLTGKTRMLTRLGLEALARTKHRGLQELLRSSCSEPGQPDSEDVAFRIAPRINAAGRIDHPSAALAVLTATSDPDKARLAVSRLNELNRTRRELVAGHFEEIIKEMTSVRPSAVVLYRQLAPKGIAGLLASKCVEHFGVPSIVLMPSGGEGVAVGSGRSVPGFDLEAELRIVQELFERFGGHAQAIGLTIRMDKIEELKQELESRCQRLKREDSLRSEADLTLVSVTRHFSQELESLEPFGEGNPAPVFRIRAAEVVATRQRWVRLRQGKHTIEAFDWRVGAQAGQRGDWLVEFRTKNRILCAFDPK